MREFFKNKTRVIITAAALAFVLLAGSLAYIFQGFRSSSGGSAPAQSVESYVYDGDGNLLESGKTYPLTGNLIFSGAAPVTETTSGVTLKAVILPENATNKKVDWSVSWFNPSSAFAAGKAAADYIKITPASDGSLTAAAVCLQAFGEKIRITVTSRDDTSIKASCTADYVQRATGIKGEFTGSGLGDKSFTFSDTEIPTINFLLQYEWYSYFNDYLLAEGYTQEEINNSYLDDYDLTYFFNSYLGQYWPGCSIKSPKYTVESSAYTLADTFDISVYIYPSDGYIDFCKDHKLYPDFAGQGYDVTKWFFPDYLMAFMLFRYGIPGDYVGSASGNLNILRLNLSSGEMRDIPPLQFDVTVTGTYSRFTKSYPAWVDVDSLKYPVKSLQLDTGNAAF